MVMSTELLFEGCDPRTLLVGRKPAQKVGFFRAASFSGYDPFPRHEGLFRIVLTQPFHVCPACRWHRLAALMDVKPTSIVDEMYGLYKHPAACIARLRTMLSEYDIRPKPSHGVAVSGGGVAKGGAEAMELGNAGAGGGENADTSGAAAPTRVTDTNAPRTAHRIAALAARFSLLARISI